MKIKVVIKETFGKGRNIIIVTVIALIFLDHFKNRYIYEQIKKIHARVKLKTENRFRNFYYFYFNPQKAAWVPNCKLI